MCTTPGLDILVQNAHISTHPKQKFNWEKSLLVGRPTIKSKESELGITTLSLKCFQYLNKKATPKIPQFSFIKICGTELPGIPNCLSKAEIMDPMRTLGVWAPVPGSAGKFAGLTIHMQLCTRGLAQWVECLPSKSK